ncbi:hypothetical protein AUJ14_02405 [Candidatus Micrarchaeota archaeon CG1_02_55_22]|nr:MAG: hypothetical protein AUJ14_02405 [Candidatus Micrarchaeota archaeon CG1_02_55_22]
MHGRQGTTTFNSNRFGLHSVIGGRENQEDAGLVAHAANNSNAVLAVFDGMGGHEGGEIASGAALDGLNAHAGALTNNAELDGLRRAIMSAHNAALRATVNISSERPPGTTVAAAAVSGNTAHIAHAGDSRAYLLRDGVLTQLTQDHRVQRILYNCIGSKAVVPRVDVSTHQLRTGDALLLVTDGVSGRLSDEELAQHIQRASSAQAAAESICNEIQSRQRSSGRKFDNATAAVYFHSPKPPSAAPVRESKRTLYRRTTLVERVLTGQKVVSVKPKHSR